ncbi:hypothetical protein SAMN04489735_107110, partial [Aneurinibacillus thermoaerophilus]
PKIFVAHSLYALAVHWETTLQAFLQFGFNVETH